MKETRAALLDYLATLPVYNTHSHLDLNLLQAGYSLEILFRNSYIAWCGVPWEDSAKSRANLFDQIRLNSFYRWTERALQDIYLFSGPLNAARWGEISERIQACYTRTGYWYELLTQCCGYQGIVLDAYWDPGSDWGYPELFHPTFRANAFFFGYHPKASDHDGNNALRLYRGGEPVASLEDYLEFFRAKVREKRSQGCVALKLPIAYDRSLDFSEVTFERAGKAFARLKARPHIEDVFAFQNFLFYELCHLAAELDMPIQVHTGMGKMDRSNALWLRKGIQNNPETKFVLLHCSSPWIEDTVALARTFHNVYPDLSWLPQLSSSASQRIIHDLIEAGMARKVCWGCDTWTPEESYGALLSFRDVLARALAEKIDEGYLVLEQAMDVIRGVTSENAKMLYRRRSPEEGKDG